MECGAYRDNRLEQHHSVRERQHPMYAWLQSIWGCGAILSRGYDELRTFLHLCHGAQAETTESRARQARFAIQLALTTLQ